MTRLIRPRFLAAAAVVLAILGLYAASPFYMLWRLQRAAERDDTATLEQLIDFPTVRAAMREDAAGVLRDKLAGFVNNKLVAGLLGKTGGPDFVNRMIDEQVTPIGAAQLIKGAKMDRASFGSLSRFTFRGRRVQGLGALHRPRLARCLDWTAGTMIECGLPASDAD